MKSKHFCSYHRNRFIASEQEAFSSWADTMKRGVKAFTEFRLDTATTYLEAAYDIGVIRSASKENVFFKSSHLIKPIEFVVQIMIQEHKFDKAIAVLSKLSFLDTCKNIKHDRDILSFLAEQYEQIELAERVFLSRPENYAPNKVVKPLYGELSLH